MGSRSKRGGTVAAWLGGLAATASAALLVGLFAAACDDTPDPEDHGGTTAAGGHGQGGAGGQGDQGGAGGQGNQGGAGSDYPSDPVPPPFDAYFDPPVDTKYADDYRVVGSITPPSWSWGEIELLEGYQAYRAEGYNLRTQKLRYQDTYQDSDYPLQTYFGALNQQLVDGFNIHYNDACAGSASGPPAPACPARGPTRPEARFVLLQHGPMTASLSCDTGRTPVLLVHGALQNGNVWLYPGGNDGAGNAYPGTTQETGFVQALEAEGLCAYAITFGNFHGDNFNQAINLSNAVRRIQALTGAPKVDVIAWSKGVLSADLYLSDVAAWQDWGGRHFEQLAAEQARRVPAFREDVRAYVALSGPHLGIDLNFRHPFDDLLIFSTAESAPVGQGPVTWGWMSAIQCVTWGYVDSPGSIFPDPYAYSVCEQRGGTWLDYWTRIYTSNITGLDAGGEPTHEESLEALNTAQGVDPADYDFDKYNIAMWGSIDDSGKFVSAYLGQMQAAYDLRSYYPTPNREDDPASYDWSQLDTDEYKWRDWLAMKLNYNPSPPYSGAGWLLDDAGHTACRNTAFDPADSPCRGQHLYYEPSTAEEYSLGYATYKMMDGIGIQAVMEMGGNFIERLRAHGLREDLDYLYVLHGSSPGAAGSIFEIDGMDCPSCDPHGDGVLFDVSVAARDQLTQGWSSAAKADRSRQEGVPYGHLEMGVTPAVWGKMIDQLNALP
jgi:triacylglycerol esterase/lipase EstA (alpha/beta hydrolase family)